MSDIYDPEYAEQVAAYNEGIEYGKKELAEIVKRIIQQWRDSVITGEELIEQLEKL